ncbi:MAG TPA: type II secretion system minor pseudopilin GspH [Rudaea sp.]
MSVPSGGAPFRARGFTLIEILVVVVILAVLAATVTLAIASAGGERQLELQANRLRELIVYACERAELTGRSIGIAIDKEGYRFKRLDRDLWVTMRDGELRPRTWGEQTTPTLTRDGHRVEDDPKATDNKPELICFDSGELTPFRLDLAMPDLARRYRIDGAPDGKVDVAAFDARAR